MISDFFQKLLALKAKGDAELKKNELAPAVGGIAALLVIGVVILEKLSRSTYAANALAELKSYTVYWPIAAGALAGSLLLFLGSSWSPLGPELKRLFIKLNRLIFMRFPGGGLIQIGACLSVASYVMTSAALRDPGFAISVGLGYAAGDTLSSLVLYVMQYGLYVGVVFFIGGIILFSLASSTRSSVTDDLVGGQSEASNSLTLNQNVVIYRGKTIHKISNNIFFVNGNEEKFSSVEAAMLWVDSQPPL